MQKRIHKFMDWFERAPFYLSIMALPVVAMLYIIAFVKNKFKENKT